MITQTEVFCTLDIEGIHKWAGCPFAEVHYLSSPHRHLFKIKAHKIVLHDDRDIEFIMLKHQIQEYMAEMFFSEETKLHNFGGYSCEWICHNLIERFKLSKCEVSEDGENGAIVIVLPEQFVNHDTKVEECKVCGNPKQEGCKVC